MSEVLTDGWIGLYREGWGSRLCPASYAHPAKNSYGLSVRIYEHALAEGWVTAGDKVVDCFAGIGGFALEAMRHGLHFRGVELEQRFVDMGQGCNCTGISKADWARYQGRWDRMRYEDGRHWCPECLMKAGTVTNERKFKPLPLPGTRWGAIAIAIAKARQPTLFDAALSTSYVRNSGKIPCTGAHHYRGNVETWAAQGMLGTAVIVQGDSRRLGEVLERAELCLSSPPFLTSLGSRAGGGGCLNPANKEKYKNTGMANWKWGQSDYGTTPGNLGNLPDTGFEAAMAISSPAWMGSDMRKGGSDLLRDNRVRTGRNPDAPGTASLLSQSPYGDEPGQLAQMPEGDLALALGSPPYATSNQNYAEGFAGIQRQDSRDYSIETSGQASYGTAAGQLAALPEGNHAQALEAGAVTPACADRGRAQACISSPPWESSIGNAANTPETKIVRLKLPNANEVAVYLKQKRMGKGLSLKEVDDYLGTVTLYSWYEGRPAGTQIPTPENWRKLKVLLSLDDRFDSGILTVEEVRATSLDTVSKTGHSQMADYGKTTGQLGQETGSTFWAASRTILEEVYKVLAPGGHCIFVCKRFVRNKKIVEFSTQWAHLCEAVGFKWIHHHKAWLVEDRGAQHTLEGGLEKREVRRLSFFRRLHTQKYPHLAILWEDVLCFVKE